MAKLKIPLFSFLAQGRLGSSFSFLRRRQVNIVESRPSPQDRRSAGQLAWRTMFNLCVDLWHTLSPAEKQAWESDARPRHMTGYAWYISQCLRPNPGIYLPLLGGTMQGDIAMATHRIIGLPLPTGSGHAVRKSYVDGTITAHAGLPTVHQDAPDLIATHAGLATVHQNAPGLIATHAGLDTGIHGVGGSTVDSVLARNAAIAAKDVGEGHILILGHNYNSISQGTWVIVISNLTYLNGYWYNSDGANADSCTYKIFLAAGTYTLRMLAIKNTDAAIVDIDIGGVEIASFDWYADPVEYNIVQEQTSIVIATSGLKDMVVRTDGKHASSTSHITRWITIALWRTP